MLHGVAMCVAMYSSAKEEWPWPIGGANIKSIINQQLAIFEITYTRPFWSQLTIIS